MNSLKHASKLSLLPGRCIMGVTSLRNAGNWNRDWKPGPYPKTEEERIAAAKKYGLHPKDYQPYPDDGTGSGDYPMFEPVSMEARDPYEHYDNPEHKRNWGEIMHRDFDAYTADRYNYNKRLHPELYKQILFFFGMVTLIGGSLILEQRTVNPKPVMKVQIPVPGVKHYSFEPAE